jgi:hypothetical protein
MHIFSQDNEIGIFAGGSNYIGDVGPTTYISPFSNNASSNYVGGIIFRKNFNKRISARTKFNYSKIGSSDNWPQTVDYRKSRKKYFKNRIVEVGLGVDFNFTDFDIFNSATQKTPYISLGISYFLYDALEYKENVSPPPAPYEYEATKSSKHPSAYNISIPITLGYKIKPSKKFIFSFEISANYSFSDNLDGSDPSKKQIQSLSNPTDIDNKFGSTLSNDWYVFSGISITYLFGKKNCYCPN